MLQVQKITPGPFEKKIFQKYFFFSIKMLIPSINIQEKLIQGINPAQVGKGSLQVHFHFSLILRGCFILYTYFKVQHILQGTKYPSITVFDIFATRWSQNRRQNVFPFDNWTTATTVLQMVLKFVFYSTLKVHVAFW